MSINWLTDKQNMVYTYNRILFNYKEEWSIDACDNMDTPLKH